MLTKHILTYILWLIKIHMGPTKSCGFHVNLVGLMWILTDQKECIKKCMLLAFLSVLNSNVYLLPFHLTSNSSLFIFLIHNFVLLVFKIFASFPPIYFQCFIYLCGTAQWQLKWIDSSNNSWYSNTYEGLKIVVTKYWSDLFVRKQQITHDNVVSNSTI